MRWRTKNSIDLIVIFSEVVIMYSLFWITAGMELENEKTVTLFPWLACSLLCYLINLVLLHRGVSVNFAYGINAALTLGFLIAGNLFFVSGGSLLTYCFMTCFFAVSALHPVSLVHGTWKAEHMLLLTEGTIVLMAVYLAVTEGNQMVAIPANIPLAISVVMDLIGLILIRVVTGNAGRQGKKRIQGAIFVLCFVSLFAFLTIGALSTVSSSVQGTLSLLFAKGAGAIKWVGQQMGAAIRFLFLLLPFREEQQIIPMEPMQSGSGQASPRFEMSAEKGIALLVTLGLCIGILVTVRFFRHHKGRRLQWNGEASIATSDRVERASRWGILKKLCKKISFELTCVIHRNSPQVLLIHAERYGRKHGVERQQSESGSGFLRRLAATISGGEAEFLLLADRIERLFYSTEPGIYRAVDAKRLRWVMRQQN